MALIYQHRRKDTGEIFYVGIGSTKKRANIKSGRNKYWHNIVAKVEYVVEIIEENLTWENACKREVELIAKIGRKDLGLGTLVNMTDGGEGAHGRRFSKSTIRILSEKKLGDKNPMFGKKPGIKSIGALERLRKFHLGRHHSEETIKKLKQIAQGKDYSGANNPKARKVLQYNVEGFLIAEYNCIKAAADIVNAQPSNISSACAGRVKTVKGFIWKYGTKKNQLLKLL